MLLTKTAHRFANRITAVPAIGLDISDRSVKCISFARESGTIRVDSFGSAAIADGIVKDGEIKDVKGLADAIAALRIQPGGPLWDRFVVASLPEEKSFLRIINVPRVKAEQLEGALSWELEGDIPLPLEEIYFDYQIIDANPASDHFDVLVVAFPKTIVDGYVETLEKAELLPLALELEAQSLARALVNPLHLQDSKLIVDIGKSRTSFVLLAEGSIAHTSTIGLSGELFHQAIAKELDISLAEAEKIKQDVGLAEEMYDGRVRKALGQALSVLIQELEKHIEFYRDHISFRHGVPSDIDSVICSGGDANLIGLDTYLARAIRKPVLIGDPFAALKPYFGSYIPPIPRNQSLQFTIAIGLAMRSLRL